jgi:hypothetical protein
MYRGSGDGISVAAYNGDRAVLLAFDLEADRAEGLAIFVVARLTPARQVPLCRPCKGRILFTEPAELCTRGICRDAV